MKTWTQKKESRLVEAIKALNVEAVERELARTKDVRNPVLVKNSLGLWMYKAPHLIALEILAHNHDNEIKGGCVERAKKICDFIKARENEQEARQLKTSSTRCCLM